MPTTNDQETNDGFKACNGKSAQSSLYVGLGAALGRRHSRLAFRTYGKFTADFACISGAASVDCGRIVLVRIRWAARAHLACYERGLCAPLPAHREAARAPPRSSQHVYPRVRSGLTSLAVAGWRAATRFVMILPAASHRRRLPIINARTAADRLGSKSCQAPSACSYSRSCRTRTGPRCRSNSSRW